MDEKRRQAQLNLYKDFILNCTNNANSLKNYIDFKRINECLQLLFPEKIGVSILDFNDTKEFEEVVNMLEKLKVYIDYNAKGKNQYSTTISWYQRFLNAKNLFSKHEKTIQIAPKETNECLQQIFYGAPGTGKSHLIKELTKGEDVIRTTFHPDSDYSTFVGCYKPTMDDSSVRPKMDLSLEDLAKQLNKYYNDTELGKIGGLQKFCYEYSKYIDGEYMSVNVSKLLELAEVPDNYSVEINKYLKFCKMLPKQKESRIKYGFVKQAFLKAYEAAWLTPKKPQYLVIEEINRGNCAQIFGDIFQLLDRNDYGYSSYPIHADDDLKNCLEADFASLHIENAEEINHMYKVNQDVAKAIKEGDMLVLPSNLYIWATMNTSDQSLFPIDSAFKRRWEWKYIKIKEGKDENGNKLDWKVDVKVDDTGEPLSWWAFIQKINEIIASMTSSADKQLGYFFCCAKDGVIDEETFVSKVIFYLWNDVFKDYGFEDASLFRYTTKDENGKETEKDLTFPDFYDEEGEKVNTERLTDFVKKVMNWKADEKKDYD